MRSGGEAAVFAVGDINKSVYGFRHADRTVFEGLSRELRAAGSHIDELDRNAGVGRRFSIPVGRVLDSRPGIEHRPPAPQAPEFDGAADSVVERLMGSSEQAAEVKPTWIAGAHFRMDFRRRGNSATASSWYGHWPRQVLFEARL